MSLSSILPVLPLLTANLDNSVHLLFMRERWLLLSPLSGTPSPCPPSYPVRGRRIACPCSLRILQSSYRYSLPYTHSSSSHTNTSYRIPFLSYSNRSLPYPVYRNRFTHHWVEYSLICWTDKTPVWKSRVVRGKGRGGGGGATMGTTP